MGSPYNALMNAGGFQQPGFSTPPQQMQMPQRQIIAPQRPIFGGGGRMRMQPRPRRPMPPQGGMPPSFGGGVM